MPAKGENGRSMKDIPEGLKRGVIIGGSILFLASLSVFFYLPKIKEKRRIKAEIAQAEKEIERRIVDEHSEKKDLEDVRKQIELILDKNTDEQS